MSVPQDQKPVEPSTPPSTNSSTDQNSDQVTPPNQDQSSNAPAGDKPADAPAGDKPADAPADAPVDEGYELEIADDSPLTEEDLDAIVEQASRYKLSKEDAEKLIKQKEDAYKRGVEKIQSEYQAKIDAQRKEIMADPMFKDDDTSKQSFASISRAIETFGDEDMVKMVKSAEYGNNVVLARFLKRLGDALAPDEKSMTGGKGSAGAAQVDGNEALKSLYPDFFKN